MTAALGLARRGLGTVWPNPAVGCILVREGRVVGRGWTQPGGRPHAESEALRRAGAAASGAAAYVSLEPCNHHGKTPPCAEALIAAGIRRAVVALKDPDPRVAGRGIARLEAAGIEVALGLLGEEAAELNAGFLSLMQKGRPLVCWKTATTLDGKIATRTGESRWITGELARARAHLLRAASDAVAVGVGTALADDPELTCRLTGLEPASPVRVVIDGRLRLALTSRLVATARATPSWLITRSDAAEERCQVLRDAGVEVIAVEPGEGDRPDLGRPLPSSASAASRASCSRAAASSPRPFSATASSTGSPGFARGASSAATGCRPRPLSVPRRSRRRPPSGGSRKYPATPTPSITTRASLEPIANAAPIS